MSPCGTNNRGLEIELLSLWILNVEFRNLRLLSSLELVSHFNWLHVTFLSTFTTLTLSFWLLLRLHGTPELPKTMFPSFFLDLCGLS